LARRACPLCKGLRSGVLPWRPASTATAPEAHWQTRQPDCVADLFKPVALIRLLTLSARFPSFQSAPLTALLQPQAIIAQPFHSSCTSGPICSRNASAAARRERQNPASISQPSNAVILAVECRSASFTALKVQSERMLFAQDYVYTHWERTNHRYFSPEGKG